MPVLHSDLLSRRANAPRVRLPPSPPHGSVSEWSGDGLQNRLHRFESDRSLREDGAGLVQRRVANAKSAGSIPVVLSTRTWPNG